MASLRDLQYAFAAALRDPSAACPVTPAGNLDVYRHNRESQFRTVLGISFPVLRRRVGDDYFRQLAHHYQQAHPSRNGDLQWVGRDFADFLAAHLAGSEYAWLADLARLEWLCELAAIETPRPALGAEALAGYAPDELEQLKFTLQPSLKLLASPFPVLSVWLTNQVANAPPVDQSLGHEAGLVLARHDSVEVVCADPELFSYISAIAGGQTLAAAVAAAGLDEAGVLRALRFCFSKELVCGVAADDNGS